MLVATASFITSDAWHGEIRVKAGITYVDPGSDLAKRFPDKFTMARKNPLGGKGRSVAERPHFSTGAAGFRTRLPSAPAAAHTATLASATNSTAPRWLLPERFDGRPVPELRDQVGGLTVRLSPTGHGDLLKLVQAARSGCETGGQLVGPRPRGWSPLVTVALVTGSGPDALHLPRSYGPDLEHDRKEVDFAREQFGAELLLIGVWHSHPANADDRPSEPDRRAMYQARSRLDLPYVVELIVCPDEQRGYDLPTISPWVIRSEYEGSRSTVVERARLHGSSSF